MTSLTEEEVDVLREAIDLLLAKRPYRKSWDGSKTWDYAAARRHAIAEELYSRLRVELAA